MKDSFLLPHRLSINYITPFIKKERKKDVVQRGKLVFKPTLLLMVPSRARLFYKTVLQQE